MQSATTTVASMWLYGQNARQHALGFDIGSRKTCIRMVMGILSGEITYGAKISYDENYRDNNRAHKYKVEHIKHMLFLSMLNIA